MTKVIDAYIKRICIRFVIFINMMIIDTINVKKKQDIYKKYVIMLICTIRAGIAFMTKEKLYSVVLMNI